MIAEFIESYGMTIIYAVLTALAGALGTFIGRIYKKYADDRTKQAIVSTCCRAVEQLYRDLNGAEKYTEAVRCISEMLDSRSIKATELEIRMLIEATCREFTEHAGIKTDNVFSEAAE